MSRRRGKITASVLVLLVFGSVLLAIVNWKAVVTEYHVYRLRRDPAFFDAVLENPENPLEEAALHKYLRTYQGGIRLCERFLDDLFAFLETQGPDFHPRSLSTGQIVGFGLYRIAGSPYFIVDGPRTITKPVGGFSRAGKLVPFFRFVDHREFELAEHPGVKLTMWGYLDDLDKNEVIVEGRIVRESDVPTVIGRAPDQRPRG